MRHDRPRLVGDRPGKSAHLSKCGRQLFVLATVCCQLCCGRSSAQDANPIPPLVEFQRELLPSPSGVELLPELEFQEGLLEFQAGNYAGALTHLRAARPMGPLAAYYEGLSAGKLQRYSEAVAAFSEIEGESHLPEDFLLEYGIALVSDGQYDEGIERLESHTLRFPESIQGQSQLQIARELAAESPAHPARDHGTSQLPFSEAEAYLDHMPEEPRNWNLTLLNGIEWDSNVLLAPEFSGLGSGQQREDARYVLALFGDYRWVQEEGLVIGTTGSLFNSSHFDLSNFDLFNVDGGIYANKVVGDVIMVGGRYDYQYTMADDTTLASEHRLVANGTVLEGDFGHLTGYYEYDHNGIRTPAPIPAQERTADVHSFGLTQAVYLFGDAGRLFAGYRYAVNNARGADFVFRSNMVTARLEIPIATENWLFTNTIVDAEARMFFDDYDHPNSLDFAGRPRSDDRLEVRAGVQRYFTEHVSLRVDYTFTNSSSNVSNLFGVRFYDYQRHVVSSQLIYDF